MASGAGEWSAEQIDDYETLISTTDVVLLKRAWRNEKASPEILPFEEALVKRAKEQIQLMEETVDDFAESGHDPLIASLYQMDLEGSIFAEILSSGSAAEGGLLILPIEKFMFHIWKMDTYRNRLSIEEEKFTERTVLSKLPDNYQSVLKQSIISEEDDMVPEPQLDTFVVAKCERATRPLYLDGSRQSASFDSRQFAILTSNKTITIHLAGMTTFKWCLEIYAFCATGHFKRN
ncbi:hypothetical protein CXB51_025293 [Gossypium anomalum]|uniref:Uncharacterized protein n=1 Tax=Gossypium anomalum TaxID=47600 RepID=A0A8J5Y1W3_9ROSI|nr:hypothetical protein CXB51_025293 [Gossypium anomalum]